MNADKLPHPTRDQLTAFGLGRLDEGLSAEVERHLGDCDACRATVESAPADTLVSLLRTEPTTNDWPPEGPPAAPPVPAELGAHPRYRVVELLGAGGMGAVYKSVHRLMERPVALKVVRRKLLDDPSAVERFRREAKAAARLSHPNIVTAYDAEQAGDVHFLVMEFVEGVSLARLVAEQGPLPVDRACEWAGQAALGLQHAHEQGMVHRDIKPQNLMLTRRGEVKILDFGLARFVSESGPTGVLTHSGAMMGTPDYIAPEQATNAHAADTRADIYSLGCTLYFLLAGRPPFATGSFVEKLAAHLHQATPPLTALRPELPAEVVRVVERMMAKDPAQRYQTPGEVARALAPFARPAPTPPPRRWRLLLVAAAALFGLVAAGVVFRFVTARGTLVIETDDPDIRVVVTQAGEVVEIIDPKSGQEVRLRAGAFDLKLDKARQGLKLVPERFTLERGGRVVVRVQREDKPVPQPVPVANGPAPLDTSKFLAVRDLDFGRPRDRRSEFENGGHLTADYKDEQYRLVQNKVGLWMGPDLTPYLGNYVCEVEGRLVGPADSGWGLVLTDCSIGRPWLGALVRGDRQVCLQLDDGQRSQPLPWSAAPTLGSIEEFHTVRVEHEAPTVRLFVNGRFVGKADVPRLLPGALRLYLFSGAKKPLPEARLRRVRVWRIPSVTEGRPTAEPAYQADFRKQVAEFPEKDDGVCGYDRGRFFVKADKGKARLVGSCPPRPLGEFYAEATAQVTAGKGGSWALVCGAGRDIGTWVEVRQDGFYRVCRVSDGHIHQLQEPFQPRAGAPPGWQRHPDLKPDGLNTVGVLVRERTLTVSFNGKWACDVMDPNYLAGDLRLAARAEGEPVRAEFQSLRVWAPGQDR
jgi:tRNA A-37 threonylcarbamoyl transferase component Bud32